MATCVKCGGWAGVGRKQHGYDCVADRAAIKPTDPAVKTGVAAGVSMAIVLIIAFFLYMLFR